MKKYFILLSLLLSNISDAASSAYISNIQNLGPGDTLFADSAGTLLDGGIVTIGYFNSGFAVNSNLTSSTALLSNFTIITSVLSGASSTNLGGAFAGYADTPNPFNMGSITTGNSLIGRGLYLFAGNQSSLSGSSQHLLIELGLNIQDDTATPQDYVANPGSLGTTVRIGSTDSVTIDPGFGSGVYQLVKLQAIPEPSAWLLTMLGSLLLLRRKR